MVDTAASPFLTSTTPVPSLAHAMAAGPSSVEGFRSPTRSRAGSDRAPSLAGSSPRTVPLGPPPSDFVPTSPASRLPLHVATGPYVAAGPDPRDGGAGAHDLGSVDVVTGSPTGHHLHHHAGVHGLGFGPSLKRASVDRLSGGRGSPLARIDSAWPAHRAMHPPPRPNSTPIHQTEFAPIEAQRRTSLADGMYGYRAEVPLAHQFGQGWLTGHQRAPIMAPAPGPARGSPVMGSAFGSPIRGAHDRTPSIASSSGAAATAPSASLRHPPSEPKTGDQPALLRTTQIHGGGAGGASGGGAAPSSASAATTVVGAEDGDDAASSSAPVASVAFANRAVLNLQGDLGSMAMGWTPEEWSARRRLVQFWRKQDANTINATFTPIAPHQFVPNSIVVSCIFREERNECYITSVDTIYLLEALVGVRFTVEEKNRIRRNLEGFRPMTVSKNKADSENFFKLIMSFPNPKPRNIEKDVKVFQWKNLASALQKILSKYSATYQSMNDGSANPSAAASANASGAPSVTGSAGEDEGPLPPQVPPAVGPEATAYGDPGDPVPLLHPHAVSPIVPHPPTDASGSPVASPTMPSHHHEAGAHHYVGPYDYGMIHHAVPPPFARAAPAHGFVVDPDPAGHGRAAAHHHHAYPVPYPTELAGLPPGYVHPHHQHHHQHHHDRSMSDGDSWGSIQHRPESGMGPLVDDYASGPSAAGGPGGGGGPFAAYDTSPPTAHPEFYSQQVSPNPAAGHHSLLEERRGSAPAFRTGPWRSFAAFDGPDPAAPVHDVGGHPEVNGRGGMAESATA